MNAFENSARAAKVARLLAAVPCGTSPAEMQIIAAWLADMTADERARFASAAGCTVPSAATWAAVVDGARSRTVVPNIFEKAGGSR